MDLFLYRASVYCHYQVRAGHARGGDGWRRPSEGRGDLAAAQHRGGGRGLRQRALPRAAATWKWMEMEMG